MANENQTTASTSTEEKTNFLSKIKWFLQKSKNDWWEQKNPRLTKAFHLTRKDSIVSMIIAIGVLCWAIYYWKIVLDEYAEINSKSDSLKDISTYGISYNSELLYPYSEWNSMTNINVNWMIEINKNVEEEIINNEIFKQQQKSYYEVLLQNIYLPSLNVWKDPYTKNFNMWILWQKYLESDKFQDLYLIQYWSDFAKYVWNDADYNTISNVTIWDKVVLEDNPAYFYTPITISFSSPNKRSFLLLINKLSTTSNQNNIALLNEFFFYLLRSIRDLKAEVINDLMEEYREEFSSSSSWDLPTNYSELTDEELSIYRDRVIWYNLYHWINDDWVLWEDSPLIDDEVILKTIKDSALCSSSEVEQKCFYNFREKYRNLPYLAYQIGMENYQWGNNARTEWLHDFLKTLPSAIAITNFGFEKISDSSFLNNKEEEYEWEITFNAYGRNITDSELEESSLMLWKLCFWSTSDQSISPDVALKRVNETISSYGWEREYTNVSSLWELQTLFEAINKNYEKMNNYEKMIKLFEIWRMLNDANLCNR